MSHNPHDPPNRKRPAEEISIAEEEEIAETTIMSNHIQSLVDHVQRFRLEAIFHPKFDNEKQNDKQIRQKMKENIQANQGHLEVSLKHSGSLVLWSGGAAQRFYSKNSVDNAFTVVAEILLRQHFARVGASYEGCAMYVQTHRLTLSFEVVTSVLGDHGDIPNRDFLILVAVADRQTGRFHTTLQLLELAHKFRLPHNDYWTFSSPTSFQKLFEFYDEARETALAKDAIQALNQAADAHVSSLYPHDIFQGDILEGIVIRYVSHVDGEQNADAKNTSTLNELDQMQVASQELLQQIPPELPSTFDDETRQGALLRTNIRKIYQENTKEQAECLLMQLLKDADLGGRRSIQRCGRIGLSSIVNHILATEHHKDDETLRIAKMIQKLHEVVDSKKVVCNVFREEQGESPRWLCMIHVLHDQTFFKFQRNMAPGDMPLFRGCCIELLTEDETEADAQKLRLETPVEMVQEESLMLKMKFLPYMVRTFGCRNGLKEIKKEGPMKFEAYIANLFRRWGISQQSQMKWLPFFRSWGMYAHTVFTGQDSPYVDATLPTLSDFSYLAHLEHFTKLYNSGTLVWEDNTGKFRGLVVVVATKRETAGALTSYIAKRLGAKQLDKNVNKLTAHDVAMLQHSGSGSVCGAVIEDGFGKLRKAIVDFRETTSLVLFGCSSEELKEDLKDLPEKQAKRVGGMCQAWQKMTCANVVSLTGSSVKIDSHSGESQNDLVSNPSGEFESMLVKLQETSDNIPEEDCRPGVLIFVPQIPGCGKSTLFNKLTETLLRQRFTDNDARGSGEESVTGTRRPRNVSVIAGDSLKQKYWPFVAVERAKDPSSIIVADKNAPPSAFSIAGKAVSGGSGVAIPVVPDRNAMRTTRVSGSIGCDKTYMSDADHCYPFSLHYLFVCLTRVLSRPKKSHAGKLDSGTKDACMIVVGFFSFYRDISADDFLACVQDGLSIGGASIHLPAIEVPFFKESTQLPSLPKDLEDVLTDALKLRYGLDLVTQKKPNYLKAFEANAIAKMEERLRDCLERYRDMALDLTVPEETSRESFLSQVNERVAELEAGNVTTANAVDASPIRLVSIDVALEHVHTAVKERAITEGSKLFGLDDKSLDDSFVDGRFAGDDFVQKTHVTCAHNSTTSQQRMRHLYGKIVGHEVELAATGILWSDRIAALAVQVPTKTMEGAELPKPTNEFTHITLWHAEKASAYESNQLPSQVALGEAKRVDFEAPVKLKGKLSFWESP